MKNILSTTALIISIIAFISILSQTIISCDTPRTGYLDYKHAKWVPDSMIVYIELDPVLDVKQLEDSIPYQSVPLSGIQGTSPIDYSVNTIESDNGYTEMDKDIQIVRNGIVNVNAYHSLPLGLYYVKPKVSNEGYIEYPDATFKIIVKQKK